MMTKEELKEAQRKACEIVDTMGLDYDSALHWTRDLFNSYREGHRRVPDDEYIKMAQRLIELDAQMCKNSNSNAPREHNAFVHFFVGGSSIRDIAVSMNVSTKTIRRYLAKSMLRMVTLIYGIDGIQPEKK